LMRSLELKNGALEGGVDVCFFFFFKFFFEKFKKGIVQLSVSVLFI